MALEQKLSLKLSQRLVMTPSLQQAIKLLQMTRLELEAVVAQELEINPILEEAEDIEEDEDDGLPLEAATQDVIEEPPTPELIERQRLEQVAFEAYLDDASGDDGGSYGESENREAPPLENTLTREPDLYDHLLWQIHLSDFPPRDREIAELIVGNLNPDGFLAASLEEIRDLANADHDQPLAMDELRMVLERVRRLDPPGIACANLRDSLLLQLDLRGEPADSLTRLVLADHWDLFLRRQYAVVARALGVTLADLEPVIEDIKTLQTRPGRKFTNDRTHYIEPDVYVLKVGDEYVIQLNDDGLPKLRISRSYRRMLKNLRQEGRQNDAQQFISEKMRSALWMIKSLCLLYTSDAADE